ncbi:hypothetical protein EDC17_10895 [Sphingobacterium alimentarium]|uniref:Uncharacterized protein n=1 Tax=Sphingobacterium alimentarium TaxID=797292 RepID=A0A4R3VLL4_9SPHI|nr:hypothetical protein EDC17_10895 [Sphingobacterium alimentarium]
MTYLFCFIIKHEFADEILQSPLTTILLLNFTDSIPPSTESVRPLI